jgi:hypothetical protein
MFFGIQKPKSLSLKNGFTSGGNGLVNNLFSSGNRSALKNNSVFVTGKIPNQHFSSNRVVNESKNILFDPLSDDSSENSEN